MNKIKIITDSCCSLSQARLNELDIECLQMSFTLNDISYNGFEHPIKDNEEFFTELSKVKSSSTSCVNTYAFTEVFEKYVNLGYDVIYIGISSGLSATYNNAVIAANEINANGQHVWVADSLSGSFGIALMLEETVKLAKAGKTAQEIFDALDKNNMNIYAIFVPSDLIFLHRSGRVSSLVASIGTMLKINPVIVANEEGKLKVSAKCLGRKKAIKYIQNFVLEKGDTELEETIYIGHTGVKEEAEEFAKFLKENTKNKNIIIDYIDYTMGCNCGPKTIALFGKKKI